jgi:hypothetical protein
MADALELSEKLVQHNRDIRRLLGADYPIKIVPFINLLDGAMKKHNCNFVKAIKVLKNEGVSVDMLLAAAYEVLNRTESI